MEQSSIVELIKADINSKKSLIPISNPLDQICVCRFEHHGNDGICNKGTTITPQSGKCSKRFISGSHQGWYCSKPTHEGLQYCKVIRITLLTCQC